MLSIWNSKQPLKYDIFWFISTLISFHLKYFSCNLCYSCRFPFLVLVVYLLVEVLRKMEPLFMFFYKILSLIQSKYFCHFLYCCLSDITIQYIFIANISQIMLFLPCHSHSNSLNMYNFGHIID